MAQITKKENKLCTCKSADGIAHHLLTCPKETMKIRQREGLVAYTFLLPALAIVLSMVALPLVMSLYLCFTDTRIDRPGKFIGIENFRLLWQSDVFWTTAYNSILFTFASVVLKLFIGLGVALLLFQPQFKNKWIRAIVLLPWVIPSVFGILGWLWILDPLYGSLNWILNHLGFSKIPWLASPFWARFSVILVNTWRGVPFFAIGLLGGLVGIPKEIYEAAEVDGADPFKKFWAITLPLLKPPLLVITLFSIVMTISDFSIVYILTRGGPVNATQVFATLAYQYGLSGGKLGMGAAISLFMFPFLLVSAAIMLGIISKGETY
ncbi:MAG: multiple sugar transport system permease protein [Candidatus Atribacteria bacterium]|jgi:multiple sugar transport system permease protein|nr:multiple sugar transport system permease protein [Candidatus Atribacteria bacterium]